MILRSLTYEYRVSLLYKGNLLLRSNVLVHGGGVSRGKKENSMSISANRTSKGRLAVALALSLVLPGVVSTPLAAVAQRQHRGFMHRHPTATAAAAGVGAYALAKHSRHGVFHRHPVLTGIGAAMVAHHYAKKHRR